MFNNALLELAKWRTREELQKEAFTPPQPGGDPSQGGMPPDPSQGGMPPGADPSQGGMPPDPSQMGGAPPPGMPPGGDPSQGGAPPQPDPSQGGGGGIDQTEVIRSILQQELAKFAPQGGGGAGGPGGNKPAKPDLNTIAMDVFQIKKMLTHLFNMQDIPLRLKLLMVQTVIRKRGRSFLQILLARLAILLNKVNLLKAATNSSRQFNRLLQWVLLVLM